MRLLGVELRRFHVRRMLIAALVIGAVEILTGVLVLRANVFGQFLGVMVAGLNGFWHFLFIGADPARSIAIMVVDGLIIYALTVHGESFES